MEIDKKLETFNFRAAFLGFIWCFKNNCWVEYFTFFILLVLVIPSILYIVGFFLILSFVPSANMGSLVIAMMWGYYSWLYLFPIMLILFSIFVGFRANKWVLKKQLQKMNTLGK